VNIRYGISCVKKLSGRLNLMHGNLKRKIRKRN